MVKTFAGMSFKDIYYYDYGQHTEIHDQDGIKEVHIKNTKNEFKLQIMSDGSRKLVVDDFIVVVSLDTTNQNLIGVVTETYSGIIKWYINGEPGRAGGLPAEIDKN